jgi:hypothetical protein
MNWTCSACFSCRVTAILLVLSAFANLGCGNPKTGTVTGTVTYQGAKVPSAKVSFYGPNDQSVSTSTDAEGNYKATDVPLGEVKVAVITPRPGPTADQVAKNPLLQKKGYVPSGENTVSVPPRYGDFAKSNLSLAVKSGSQKFDIELK